MKNHDYYNAVLDYRRPDSNRISGYITGGDTLEQAVKGLEYGINYYLHDAELVNEHIVIVNAYIDRCCGNCAGSGVVSKRKRLYATKVCPVCKDKPTTRIETWYKDEVKVCE